MTEVELCSHLKAWLTGRGWHVLEEQALGRGSVDLLAKKGVSTAAIEAKGKLSGDAIRQAKRWLGQVHRVWIVTWGNGKRSASRVLATLGIGLLHVHRGSGQVTISLDARRFKLKKYAVPELAPLSIAHAFEANHVSSIPAGSKFGARANASLGIARESVFARVWFERYVPGDDRSAKLEATVLRAAEEIFAFGPSPAVRRNLIREARWAGRRHEKHYPDRARRLGVFLLSFIGKHDPRVEPLTPRGKR